MPERAAPTPISADHATAPTVTPSATPTRASKVTPPRKAPTSVPTTRPRTSPPAAPRPPPRAPTTAPTMPSTTPTATPATTAGAQAGSRLATTLAITKSAPRVAASRARFSPRPTLAVGFGGGHGGRRIPAAPGTPHSAIRPGAASPSRPQALHGKALGRVEEAVRAPVGAVRVARTAAHRDRPQLALQLLDAHRVLARRAWDGDVRVGAPAGREVDGSGRRARQEREHQAGGADGRGRLGRGRGELAHAAHAASRLERLDERGPRLGRARVG